MTSARRKRSMCAASHGSRATRSSAIDARLGGLIRCEVGVGQQHLRLVHRLFEAAVDADFDELEQRGNLPWRAGHEVLQDSSPLPGSPRPMAASTTASTQANGVSGIRTRNDQPSSRRPERAPASAARRRRRIELALPRSRADRRSISTSGIRSLAIVAGAVLVEELARRRRCRPLAIAVLASIGRGLAVERVDAGRTT